MPARIGTTLAALGLCALLLAACGLVAAPQQGPIQASGIIEATEVNVSPELGGRVTQVAARAGATVAAGTVLIKLDDTALQAQLVSAEAALRVAQANYDLLAASPTAEQVRQAQANVDAAQARYDGLQAGAREEQVAQAQADLDAAQAALAQLLKGPTDEELALAQLAVDQAKNALWAAQASRDGICGNKNNPDYACDAADAQTAIGETGVQEAQERLAQLKGGASDEAIAEGRSAVDAARAQLALAKAPVTASELAAAQAQVAAAQAALDGLEAGARPEALAAAQAQVDVARAQVDEIQVQIDKTAVRAPIDGAVLTRGIEPGEVLQAGATAMVLADLSALRVTVYIPEDRYGQVALGGHATLAVDSYPDQTFDATVTRVASQAEFTPNNVQTKEQRQSTVYAVELAIGDAQGKLLPGMPTDVTFGP